jgi:hypothetical protein
MCLVSKLVTPGESNNCALQQRKISDGSTFSKREVSQPAASSISLIDSNMRTSSSTTPIIKSEPGLLLFAYPLPQAIASDSRRAGQG